MKISYSTSLKTDRTADYTDVIKLSRLTSLISQEFLEFRQIECTDRPWPQKTSRRYPREFSQSHPLIAFIRSLHSLLPLKRHANFCKNF